MSSTPPTTFDCKLDVTGVSAPSPCSPFPVVLSLFPGIGLLDRAFEAAGFCVVRGPDVIWGGDVKCFHAPSGKFEGVIGGPPCQIFSALKRLNPKAGEKHGNLIPEFERVVGEAQPLWWLMENVPQAPEPTVPGYKTNSQVLNNRWLGAVQERTRRISFGTRDGRALHVATATFEAMDYSQAVTSSSRRVSVKLNGSGRVKRTYTEQGKRHGPSNGARTPLGEMCLLQGLPENWLDECPITETGKRKCIGNGVPVMMGTALAAAVRCAMKMENADFRRGDLNAPNKPVGESPSPARNG